MHEIMYSMFEIVLSLLGIYLIFVFYNHSEPYIKIQAIADTNHR